jgi:hypothetical protein
LEDLCPNSAEDGHSLQEFDPRFLHGALQSGRDVICPLQQSNTLVAITSSRDFRGTTLRFASSHRLSDLDLDEGEFAGVWVDDIVLHPSLPKVGYALLERHVADCVSWLKQA